MSNVHNEDNSQITNTLIAAETTDCDLANSSTTTTDTINTILSHIIHRLSPLSPSNHPHRHNRNNYVKILKSLQKAGDAFLSLSELISFPDESSESTAFQLIGDALIEAHKALSIEWIDVTIALGTTSVSFSALSNHHHNTNRHQSQAEEEATEMTISPNNYADLSTTAGLELESRLYDRIAQQLKDVSKITGCLSIGPPASVPNLADVRDCLFRVAWLLLERDFDGEGGSAGLARLMKEATNGFDGVVRDFD